LKTIRRKKYIAYKCGKCGIISVFPSAIGDGNTCIECSGYILPIGEARVHEKANTTMTIGINVDTTQLDEAMDKAEKLNALLCEINKTSPPL